MRTIGFPISKKENENRRALIPVDVAKTLSPQCLFFETGYGKVLGYSDEDYLKVGANVVSREEVLKKEIICDPKVGDAEYLEDLKNQIVFGWVHAVQNKDITDNILKGNNTAYAWEDMFENGRHVFWRNNELAGEAAILQAYMCYGKMPYGTKVAVIGRGNIARGAMKILYMLGAEIVQYDRKTEKELRKHIHEYDVIVNCILWDTSRIDHIIYKEDLSKMKPDSMIIDVSCDRHGGVETSEPTTIEAPTYVIDGVLHYVVDHTPALFYKTFTSDNSAIIYPYINQLLSGDIGDVLKKACIIKDGLIIDQRINEFQGR